MSARFKPNNIFAILIAIALVVLGFVLSFINKRAVSAPELTAAKQMQTVVVPDQAAQVDAEAARPQVDSGDP